MAGLADKLGYQKRNQDETDAAFANRKAKNLIGLHSAALDGHSSHVFEAKLNACQALPTYHRQLRLALNEVATEVFSNLEKAYNMQKKHLVEGKLNVHTNTPNHFADRLDSLSKHLVCFPQKLLGNGQLKTNKSLTAGALIDTLEEARKPMLT